MASTPRYSATAFHSSTSYELAGGHYGWLPDDGRVLVSSDETGIFNVYALDVETGEKSPLTTSTTNSCFVVSAFPGDDRILFTADHGGDELNHLFVRESSGEVRDLTPGEHLKAMFVGWSRDGRYFFAASNARDPQAFDLYRYRASDYAAERVFENNECYAIEAIGDDRYVALAKVHTNANTDIYLLDWAADDPVPRLITPHDGDIRFAAFCFSADNRHLVLSTNERGEYAEAWRYDIASKERSPLMQADWDVVAVRYSRSGRYRVAVINEDARNRVEIVDIKAGNALRLPPLPQGEIMAVSFSRSEDKVALLIDADTSPADVYVVDPGSDSPARRLTTALNAEIDETDLVTAEVVRYPGDDGLDVPGVLYRPRDASPIAPCPALVYVHGGPGGQSRCGYNPTIQHIVNHGYAVFAANNRGSSGYGKTFFHMADRRHGEVDLDDIVAARHYLASLNWIDGERVGVIGGSYGGYMVGAALAFRPASLPWASISSA
ncbi:MAG: prolyl oligopeptidase family serine peptidase [Gammaproteobacteria bacterium]|nr:prolyl oligopeptidase family serine peptidase [Gammaproteobacteria bacterium]